MCTSLLLLVAFCYHTAAESSHVFTVKSLTSERDCLLGSACNNIVDQLFSAFFTPNTKGTDSQELSLIEMASTESGAAVSMKSEKANRESLAKKKSVIKAELEKTAAELEEIEQLKAEAEDLEDEEMLSEMEAEQQRLQVSECTPALNLDTAVTVKLHMHSAYNVCMSLLLVCSHTVRAMMQHLLLQALKKQYTAELETIQQQQAAAQQALRQRFRRLTGDRALGSSSASLGSSSTDFGASGKSAFSAQGTADSGAAVPEAVNSNPALPSSTENSSTYTAQAAAPHSSGTQAAAQSVMPHTSHTAASPMSNQPLSASWGEAASVQTNAPDHAQASLQHPRTDTTQQPDSAQNQDSRSSMPQEGDSSYFTATVPAVGGTALLSSTTYSQQEPVSQSATDTHSTPAHSGDHTRIQATGPEPARPDTAAMGSEQGAEINRSRLQAPESETSAGAESDQTLSRTLVDSSKPPRPASGQQGIANTGNAGQQPTALGMLHDRSGMLSFFHIKKQSERT